MPSSQLSTLVDKMVTYLQPLTAKRPGLFCPSHDLTGALKDNLTQEEGQSFFVAKYEAVVSSDRFLTIETEEENSCIFI